MDLLSLLAISLLTVQLRKAMVPLPVVLQYYWEQNVGSIDPLAECGHLGWRGACSATDHPTMDSRLFTVSCTEEGTF